MKIVGISGKAGSGKDTLAGFLVEHQGFVRIALAEPLRRFVSDITGLSMEDLTAGPLKEAPLEWLGGTSPRRLMQTIGTEWGRDMIDESLWLKVAARRVEEARAFGAAGVVIPDVRFENEAMLVRELGGSVVVVDRPGVASVADHASERPCPPGWWTTPWSIAGRWRSFERLRRNWRISRASRGKTHGFPLSRSTLSSPKES